MSDQPDEQAAVAIVVPDTREDRERRASQFYADIGRCITIWGQAEDALFWLCRLALDTDPERTAIVFYKTPTLKGRLDLADELIRSRLPKRERKSGGHDHPIVKEWETIKKRADELLEVRNHLAHQSAVGRYAETEFIPSSGPGVPHQVINRGFYVDVRVKQYEILDVLQGAHTLAGVQEVLATPTSIGGIQGRGVDWALHIIDDEYAAGARFIAGSDIAGFFTKIPRHFVTEFVATQTDDHEFLDLLDRAMTVELANASRMDPDDLKLFPTGQDGVAQGCPLSAFAGNVVLRDFDRAMNDPERGVKCVRYIDDFILLSRSEVKVNKAMMSARARLKTLGMSIYDPAIDPSKAFKGGIVDGHVFLGYSIVPGLFPPAPKATDRLLSRISTELSAGRTSIKRSLRGQPIIAREHCYVQTLWNVDQILRGWAGSFQSSKCAATMQRVDAQVDRLLLDFEAFFRRSCLNASNIDRRRAMGIRLLQDGVTS